MCINAKAQNIRDILAYLTRHPHGQDTLEGIVEWWLLEQKIQHRTAEVKEALADLLAKRLIVERKGVDARSHYKINRRKSKEISLMLKQ